MSRKKPKSRIRKWTENVVKKIIKTPFSITANMAKSAVSKANPFDQNINKNDVSDTGVESMRLAYTSVKKGKNAIKTVKRSVKTTQRTIKTTGNVVKSTGTVIYRTTAFTVKSTILVSKFVGNVVVHIVASLMNPIVIFLAVMIIIFMMMALLVFLLLGGGVSASNSNKQAYSSASGLVNVPSQYQIGLEYLNTALENHHNNFNSLIDSLYFNYDDLTHSNLIYMERTDTTGRKAVYEKSFATDERKNAVKSEWNISITEREFLAIAYVYLENEINTSNNSTEHGIYEVSYTQEVFDTIVSKCAVYSDSIYGGQKCHDENCTRHVEYVDNPDYYYALEKVNEAADNYNNSGDDYWGHEYEYWSGIFNSTSPTIEQVTYICEYQHDLHSVGLVFFDKETIMNALNFDNISKQWVELTERGFENNPDIS